MEILSDVDIDRYCKLQYYEASPLLKSLAPRQAVVNSFRAGVLESVRQTSDQEFIDWFYGLNRTRLSAL